LIILSTILIIDQNFLQYFLFNTSELLNCLIIRLRPHSWKIRTIEMIGLLWEFNIILIFLFNLYINCSKMIRLQDEIWILLNSLRYYLHSLQSMHVIFKIIIVALIYFTFIYLSLFIFFKIVVCILLFFNNWWVVDVLMNLIQRVFWVKNLNVHIYVTFKLFIDPICEIRCLSLLAIWDSIVLKFTCLYLLSILFFYYLNFF